MKNDIIEVVEACIDGTLDQIDLQFEDNAAVCVVLASDGYSYFDEEMIYSVNRQDNQYVLKQKGSNSRIVIKNGNLSYTNHNINDGETVFTLKITADK